MDISSSATIVRYGYLCLQGNHCRQLKERKGKSIIGEANRLLRFITKEWGIQTLLGNVGKVNFIWEGGFGVKSYTKAQMSERLWVSHLTTSLKEYDFK